MTREAYGKLTDTQRAAFDGYRARYKDPRFEKVREATRQSGCAYLRGLADAGAITEMERRALCCYMTI